MTQLRNKQIKLRLKQLDKFLLDQYKEQSIEKKRDYALYEKEFKKRINKVKTSKLSECGDLIHQIISNPGELNYSCMGKNSRIQLSHTLTWEPENSRYAGTRKIKFSRSFFPGTLKKDQHYAQNIF